MFKKELSYSIDIVVSRITKDQNLQLEFIQKQNLPSLQATFKLLIL